MTGWKSRNISSFTTEFMLSICTGNLHTVRIEYVVVCVTDIIKDSLCAYCAEDMPQFKTVVAFDCRGVEPTDFEPRVRSFLY